MTTNRGAALPRPFPLDTMKRSKRPLPIPQHEFGFTPDTFSLFPEFGLDGERITKEQTEAQQARLAAESAQAAFFTPQEIQP